MSEMNESILLCLPIIIGPLVVLILLIYKKPK
jgi:hypothetical protein